MDMQELIQKNRDMEKLFREKIGRELELEIGINHEMMKKIHGDGYIYWFEEKGDEEFWYLLGEAEYFAHYCTWENAKNHIPAIRQESGVLDLANNPYHPERKRRRKRRARRRLRVIVEKMRDDRREYWGAMHNEMLMVVQRKATEEVIRERTGLVINWF